MSYAVGIDIGGTKTAIGIVSDAGEVLAKALLPTDLSIPPEQMTAGIAAEAHRLLSGAGIKESELLGLGIGAPGPLDTKRGQIAEPPNLRSWWGFPVVDLFKRHFSCRIAFENDATAAALAEKWVGAAQAADDFVYITISTGIGAGIVSGGRLITGASGNAGEIGHMVVDPAGGTCDCGQRGCFEHLASGTAIARAAGELLGRPVTSKEAFDLAFSGSHPAMEKLVNDVFRHIGVGCVTLINAFDPELLVIGGGVSQVGAPLFKAVSGYVEQFALNPSGRRTPVVPAALEQDAGLIGAAALIHLR